MHGKCKLHSNGIDAPAAVPQEQYMYSEELREPVRGHIERLGAIKNAAYIVSPFFRSQQMNNFQIDYAELRFINYMQIVYSVRKKISDDS